MDSRKLLAHWLFRVYRRTAPPAGRRHVSQPVSLVGGRRFGLPLSGFGPVGVTDIALGAVRIAALGVEGVGALAPGVEVLAGGVHSVSMGCGCSFEPGCFRRLCLGLGPGRPCLRLGLVGECLALLDSLCLATTMATTIQIMVLGATSAPSLGGVRSEF
jgi:hypothetical protein